MYPCVACTDWYVRTFCTNNDLCPHCGQHAGRQAGERYVRASYRSRRCTRGPFTSSSSAADGARELPVVDSVEVDSLACSTVGIVEQVVEPSVASAEEAAWELPRTVAMTEMAVRGIVRSRLR